MLPTGIVLITCMLLTVLLVVLALWIVLLRTIARIFQEPVIWFFNRSWRPQYIIKGVPGDRLEIVREPNKPATVKWDSFVAFLRLSYHGVGLGFMLALATVLFIGINGIVVHNPYVPSSATEIPLPLWLIPIMIPVFITTSLTPIFYWYYEWDRRTNKVVITTRSIYTRPQLQPTLTGLIVGHASLPEISRGPTSLLEEAKTGADIQQVKPGVKTSWFRDQWTAYLFKKYGVGTIYLPSRVTKSEDYLSWIDWVASADSINMELSRRAKIIEAREQSSSIQRAVEGTIRAMGLAPKAENEQDLASVRPTTTKPIPEWEFFTVDDPGVWNPRNGEELIKLPQEVYS